ncbi:MAG: ABC transporter permease [Micrococcales bacterium]|nr:ABC transporter permease [Micrococcales bacterium]
MSDPDAPTSAPLGAVDGSQIPEEQRAPESEPAAGSRRRLFLRELSGGTAAVSVLSIVAGLLVGAVFIAIFNTDGTMAYFFSAPGLTFAQIGVTYQALFTGSIFADSGTLLERLAPLTDTLRNATPLIAAGLGVALGFRTGLFNIGGRGQIIIGAIFSGALVFNSNLPGPVLVPLAGILAILGGALWGGIVGILRAVSGAHEVITTSMRTYVAFCLID